MARAASTYRSACRNKAREMAKRGAWPSGVSHRLGPNLVKVKFREAWLDVRRLRA